MFWLIDWQDCNLARLLAGLPGQMLVPYLGKVPVSRELKIPLARRARCFSRTNSLSAPIVRQNAEHPTCSSSLAPSADR
jgi:hypothetical protein